MRVLFNIFFIFIVIFSLNTNEINQSYIQVYGEGPKGRIPTGFEVSVYKII